MSSVGSRSSSTRRVPCRWIFSPAARLGRKSAGAAAIRSTSVESNSLPSASASSAAVSTSTRRDAGRRRQRDVGRDQRHLRAAAGGPLGKRQPHAAARSGCR